MTRHNTAAADLAAWLRNSPDVRIGDMGGLNIAPAELDAATAALEANAGALGAGVKTELKRATRDSEKEKLARQFEYLWRMWDGPELTKEHRFHVQRRWRFDYYHAASNTAIELHGGVWSEGRHTRGRGFLGDLEKMNAAQMQGITVLQLGTGQVDDAHVGEIADWVRKQTKGAR